MTTSDILRYNAEKSRFELSIYDSIGVYGITSSDVLKALNSIRDRTKPLAVFINSAGGSVFDGQAIYTMLKRYEGKVTTQADGLAASIASLIFLAGDERIVATGAAVMTHAPWTMVVGNAEDLQEAITLLEELGDNMATAYAEATGLTPDMAKASFLDGENWFNAESAVSAKLATSVVDTPAMVASVDTVLYAYAKVPDWLKVEASDKPATIRDAEQALKRAGLSRTTAKAVLARGWQAESETPSFEWDAQTLNKLKDLLTT